MAKRTRSEFWRKYREGILVVALIAGAVIYTQVQSPRYLFKLGNPVAYALSEEVLTKEDIITLTNNIRALNGQPPLKENLLLNNIAELRAKDMLEKQYFAHVSPAGQQVSDIANNLGYRYRIIAENIERGNFYTSQNVINNWMESPGHRNNILDKEMKEIGVAVLKGIINGAEMDIAVQIFGLQLPPVPQHKCDVPSKNLLDDIELRKAEIDGLNDQLYPMKQELDAEKETINKDRISTYNDSQKIDSLNVNISAHNMKCNWYNRALADTNSKFIMLESMINEYNKKLKEYNDCRLLN